MHDQVTLQRPQPTSLVPPPAPPPPCETRGKTAREGDGPVLRFGFNYRQVEALAWSAVHHHIPSRGLDLSDRFEAAWGAVVEYLYAASEPPSPLDLTGAGLAGLDRLRKRGLDERGYFRKNRDGNDPGAWTVPAGSFYRYWTRPAEPTPEDQAVEATAVRQVMAALGPTCAEALAALAEHGDYETAARTLGLSQTAFNARVRRGRAAFLALWHEHEAVPGRRRTDKRLYRRVSRSEPADHADTAQSLSAARDAFGGRSTIASVDLLARLAAADPGRYGAWDCHDLSTLLGAHDVTRHRVAVDGDDRKRVGYRLEDITSALAELTATRALTGQAA
jgi:DNA-directed RNA polymerase specialized sigma24 family protein